MASIEIDAEEPELIDIRLVGVDYLIKKPKAALSLSLAESVKSKRVSKPKPNATPEEVEAFQQAQAELADSSQKMLQTWIKQAFGPEGSKKIKKRLADPEDLLDLPHLMNLMSKVAEATSGNPTT